MNWPTTFTHTARFVDFPHMAVEQWDAAFEQTLNAYKDQASQIAQQTHRATFDNTLGALEAASVGLSDVFGALSCCESHSTEEIQKLMEKWQPVIVEETAVVLQNPKLYDQVMEAYQHEAAQWDPAQMKLFSDLVRSMKKVGAGLSDEDKSRVVTLSKDLSSLENQFNQLNLANSNVTINIRAAALSGADPSLIGECVHHLVEGQEFVAIPVSTPFVEPLLSQVHDRTTRQQLHDAWKNRGAAQVEGDQSTTHLIEDIVTKRAQLAQVLGYESWCHYTLDGQMASSPEAVFEMLYSSWNSLVPLANQDLSTLHAFAQSQGLDTELEAWDVPYYAEKYRASYYNVDSNAIKEYFPLERVRASAFEAAHKVFGVSFVEDPSIPSYHPDTLRYAVQLDGQDIGVLIADDYVRATKPAGAWMNVFASGHRMGQGNGAGVINVLNIPSPGLGEPCLLSYMDVVTLFHELGHALHGLLAQTPYPSQSGTNVVRDFVELPSQIFENWATSPDALRDLARHWKTGAPMPEDMFDRLLESQKFGNAFEKTTYLQSALIDMQLHRDPSPSHGRLLDWQEEVVEDLNAPAALPPRHKLNHFSHLFGGGYSSGYYSYLWAEVLEADAFLRFKEEGGRFAPAASQALRALYQAGGSQNAMELFTAYRGREPDPAALFERWGIPAPVRRAPVA